MPKEVFQEKLEKGWLHVKMFFEILSSNEEVAKKSLEEHVSKLGRMEDIKIVSQKFGEVEKVENPSKILKEGYSQIAEVEIFINSLENLILTVIFFGPSSVEIIEPKEIKIKVDSAQSIANSVAEMMHRYAAEGMGGIVISAKK